jgi:hypothetical protein
MNEGHVDLDLDAQMAHLEAEWRRVYESSMLARAAYQSLAADQATTLELLDSARERMDRADASRARTMAEIERLEYKLFARC